MDHILDSHYNEIGLSTESRFQLDIDITNEVFWRKFYAGQALQGLCTPISGEPGVALSPPVNETARKAVRYADALLVELAKEQENGK